MQEELIKAARVSQAPVTGGSTPRSLPIIKSNASELTPTPTSLAPTKSAVPVAGNKTLKKPIPATKQQYQDLPPDGESAIQQSAYAETYTQAHACELQPGCPSLLTYSFLAFAMPGMQDCDACCLCMQ